MRFVRVVLALVFGLAVLGPETHACPVHSTTPAGHQHDTSGHQDSGGGDPSGDAHCTCPQACALASINVSLPAASNAWTGPAATVLTADLEPFSAIVLPSRTHFLPFALAPPPPRA